MPITAYSRVPQDLPSVQLGSNFCQRSLICSAHCEQRPMVGQIIDYFVDEYTAGRTPNPCVQCNNWLKFGKLFDYADSVGAEFVATGHYARLDRASDDRCRARRHLLSRRR